VSHFAQIKYIIIEPFIHFTRLYV